MATSLRNSKYLRARMLSKRLFALYRRLGRLSLLDVLADAPSFDSQASGDEHPVSDDHRELVATIVNEELQVSEADVEATKRALQVAAMVPLQTHEFSRDDRRVRTHPAVVKWMDDNLPDSKHGRHARYEILLLCEADQRNGSFTFSTVRVREVLTRKTYELLLLFTRSSGLVSTVKGHHVGKHSKRYALKLDEVVVNHEKMADDAAGNFDIGDLHTVNDMTLPSSRDARWAWRPEHPVFATIPHCWMVALTTRWHQLALVKGWFVGCDMLGTNFSAGIQETLQTITIERDFNDAKPVGYSDVEWESKRKHHKAFHRKLVRRSLIRRVRHIHGRLYHGLSSCPKTVRRQLRMAGERIGEVDISGSYLCALASQLWEDTEDRRRQKRTLIEWLRSGDIYEKVAEAAGYSCEDRGELKKQFQMQCLFWKDHTPLFARPLWVGLEKLFPNLAKFILGIRRHVKGASGLSDNLMWRESSVMFAIFTRLGKLDIPFLPNHDGILVRVSDVERVKEIATSIATQVLGFEPMVKAKTV